MQRLLAGGWVPYLTIGTFAKVGITLICILLFDNVLHNNHVEMDMTLMYQFDSYSVSCCCY